MKLATFQKVKVETYKLIIGKYTLKPSFKNNQNTNKTKPKSTKQVYLKHTHSTSMDGQHHLLQGLAKILYINDKY